MEGEVSIPALTGFPTCVAEFVGRVLSGQLVPLQKDLQDLVNLC